MPDNKKTLSRQNAFASYTLFMSKSQSHANVTNWQPWQLPNLARAQVSVACHARPFLYRHLPQIYVST